jgi:hypothetical protein
MRTDNWFFQDLSSHIANWSVAMDQPSHSNVSPIRTQAADALRRARKLPVGHDRNDLRQLAVGLLWLEKKGFVAIAQDGATALREIREPQG